MSVKGVAKARTSTRLVEVLTGETFLKLYKSTKTTRLRFADLKLSLHFL